MKVDRSQNETPSGRFVVRQTLKRVVVSYLTASLTACWMTYFWTWTGPFTCCRSLTIASKSEGKKRRQCLVCVRQKRPCFPAPGRLLLTPAGLPHFLDDATPQLCLASVEWGYENGAVCVWARLGALQVLLRAQPPTLVGGF